jgi:predicted transcriptional regulator
VANFSLRGVDEYTVVRLRQEARRQKVSVNALILRLIRRGIVSGARDRRRRIFRDLDGLAGTWTAAEANAFDRAVADFERVDDEHWR